MKTTDVKDTKDLAEFLTDEHMKRGDLVPLSRPGIDEAFQASTTIGALRVASGQQDAAGFDIVEYAKLVRERYDAAVESNRKILDTARQYRMAVNNEVVACEALLKKFTDRIAEVERMIAAVDRLKAALADPAIRSIMERVS